MLTIGTKLMGGAALLLLTAAAYAAEQAAQPANNAGINETQSLTSHNDQRANSQSTMPLALAPMALNSMSNPPDKIANARVVDDKGITVGAVKKVEMDAAGKPIKLDVALLGSQQVVALESSNLSYDEPSNVVIAGMDKSQIVQMPVTRPPG